MSEEDLVARAHTLFGDAAVRIVFTSQRHCDNWFSHWDERRRTAVISLFGWRELANVSPEAFIAYETVLFGLNTLSPGRHPLEMVHQETRGCLFDLCALKTDIEIKLQVMDLCEACRREWRARGNESEELMTLCAVVRSLARPIA